MVTGKDIISVYRIHVYTDHLSFGVSGLFLLFVWDKRKKERSIMLESDFFDNETESIIDISAFYGERKQIADKCLIIFSKEIHTYLLENFRCEIIGEIGACNGHIPIYCLNYKGEKIAFYLTGIGSAVASSMCYESHYIMGATKYIMFGSCGSLDHAKTKGRFILPTESYRGEGASHYYAPSSDYIAIRNSNALADIFDKMKVPYIQGRVWTTDSMLRETKGLVEKRTQEGCIAVEMELAGVQAICDFYGMQLYDFLEPGDVLSDSGYEAEGLKGANHNIGKVLIALEIASFL